MISFPDWVKGRRFEYKVMYVLNTHPGPRTLQETAELMGYKYKGFLTAYHTIDENNFNDDRIKKESIDDQIRLSLGQQAIDELQLLGEKKTPLKAIQTSFIKLMDGIAEEVYNPKTQTAEFCVCRNGKIEIKDKITVNNSIEVTPYNNKLLSDEVVRFPEYAKDYGNDQFLKLTVQDFIHRYLDISESYERIATYYVLLSWLYDNFLTLPYLRALGDSGSGKTRFLVTIGNLCYKPMFAGGASSTSPIFRIIDMFKGTLIIDEGDFKKSDETQDIIKILNCGYQQGMPVLRSDKNGNGYMPMSYQVYGPKILATKRKFADSALESRCLTEVMERDPREDIPTTLPSSFAKEAREIRNMLLMWRFKNYMERDLSKSPRIKGIELRLNEIIMPLMSIVDDEDLKSDIKMFSMGIGKQLIEDRGMSTDADILRAILRLEKEYSKEELTMKNIAEMYNTDIQKDADKISARKAGYFVKDRLRLERKRTGGVWKIVWDERKIERKMKQFGIEKEDELR